MAKRTRRNKLATIDTEALSAELQRRERALVSLERKHTKLMDQLVAVEAEIEALGGPAGASPRTRKAASGRATSGRKRPRNDMKLDDALAKLLKGKTMGVTEAAEAVQKAGYKTSAANFRTIVNQTMLKSPKIKKVARGQYTAK
ncbi:MAG: hypothetical protein KC492_41175 [Myxococcales bacterium]|nr:hypothetical protein [Myxococcales bacterium]